MEPDQPGVYQTSFVEETSQQSWGSRSDGSISFWPIRIETCFLRFAQKNFKNLDPDPNQNDMWYQDQNQNILDHALTLSLGNTDLKIIAKLRASMKTLKSGRLTSKDDTDLEVSQNKQFLRQILLFYSDDPSRVNLYSMDYSLYNLPANLFPKMTHPTI